jgi:hypothetical protein
MDGHRNTKHFFGEVVNDLHSTIWELAPALLFHAESNSSAVLITGSARGTHLQGTAVTNVLPVCDLELALERSRRDHASHDAAHRAYLEARCTAKP